MPICSALLRMVALRMSAMESPSSRPIRRTSLIPCAESGCAALLSSAVSSGSVFSTGVIPAHCRGLAVPAPTGVVFAHAAHSLYPPALSFRIVSASTFACARASCFSRRSMRRTCKSWRSSASIWETLRNCPSATCVEMTTQVPMTALMSRSFEESDCTLISVTRAMARQPSHTIQPPRA